MASTQTDIMNRAITKLGALRIASPADDTKEARELSSMWNALRDNELRIRRWSFSLKRVLIAASTTVPAFGFTASYPLPTDCLRVIEINDIYATPDQSDYRNAPGQSYTIEGRNILTNGTGSLKLRYVSTSEDTAQWDSSFCEVFACRLAFEAAEALTQSPNRKKMVMDEYLMAIGAARRVNAIEQEPEYVADDTWLLARLRG